MSRTVYRFRIHAKVKADDVESTLLLAIVALESLHGETEVRLDAAHLFDAGRRVCVIDASRPVGRDLCRLFAGLFRHEFGDDSFRVELSRPRHPGEGDKECGAKPADSAS